MDDESSRLDQVLMDSGGRILTASFDFKTRYLDEISYIVNEVNPLVEAVPDTAVSAVVGPSERLVISTFWRQRNEGKRDRILTRALIASRESYHSFGANPFKLQALLAQPSSLVRQMNAFPISITDTKVETLESLTGDEQLATKLVELVLFGRLMTLPVVFLGARTNVQELTSSLLATLPLPLRQISFSTFVNGLNPIFAFSFTQPGFFRDKFYLDAQSKACIVFDLDTGKPVRLKPEIGRVPQLIGTLAQTMTSFTDLDIISTKLDAYFIHQGPRTWNLAETAQTILELAARGGISELDTGRSIQTLESSLIDALIAEAPERAESLSSIRYGERGSDGLIEMVKVSLQTDSAKPSQIADTAITKVIEGEDTEALSQMLALMNSAHVPIPEVETHVKQLCALSVRRTSLVPAILKPIGLLLEERTDFRENASSSVVDFLFLAEGECGHTQEISELWARVFAGNARCRRLILQKSPDKFVELLGQSGNSEPLVAEVISDPGVTKSAKIRLLTQDFARRPTHQNSALGKELVRLLLSLSPKDLTHPEQQAAIEILSSSHRLEFVLGFLTGWSRFAGTGDERDFVVTLKDFLTSSFSDVYDERMARELIAYFRRKAETVKESPNAREDAFRILDIIALSNARIQAYFRSDKRARKELWALATDGWKRLGLDERMREDPYNWFLDTFENSIFKPMQTVLKLTTEGEKSRIQKEALAATRRLWSLVTEAVLDRMDARLS